MCGCDVQWRCKWGNMLEWCAWQADREMRYSTVSESLGSRRQILIIIAPLERCA